MEVNLSPASILPLAAAANALILAIAIGWRALRRRARPGLFAAAYLCVAALATASIAIDHAMAGGAAPWLGVIESAATFAAGPLFFLLVASLLKVSAPSLIVLAPAALAMVAVLAIWRDPFFIAEKLVFMQIAYFAAAAAIAFWRPVADGKIARLVFACLGGVGIIHAAQLLRFAWPQAAAIRDLVPYLGAFAFLALAWSIYAGARLKILDRLFVAPTPAPPGATDLLARVDASLLGLCAAQDLSIDALADAVRAPAAGISDALKAVRGETFRDALRRARVAKAKILLRAPQEARTSVEAIGLLAGFRSRSAFYDAFREETGVTPAAFRRESGSETCPER